MDYQFYIVATPIGNISDISIRAIDVLKSINYIACEDTRVTKHLCEKYGITAKLIDCHKFNEKEKSEYILKLLNDGNKIALVSDAGTPMISDPGAVLINVLKENNIKITSIPGACAITTFLSMLPRKNEEFAFIGFLPRVKNQAENILKKYRYTNCVFYESPNRLSDTLLLIKDLYGGDKQISVGRELTKIYEEIITDKVRSVIDYYEKNPLKGEIVVMVYSQDENDFSREEMLDKINILKKEGYSPKDISKILSKLYGYSKNKIYETALD